MIGCGAPLELVSELLGLYHVQLILARAATSFAARQGSVVVHTSSRTPVLQFLAIGTDVFNIHCKLEPGRTGRVVNVFCDTGSWDERPVPVS